jgi:hypothetical protein
MCKPRLGFETLLYYLYIGIIVLFWVLAFYFYFQGNKNPGAAVERIILLVSPLWSPTSDSVLNFLIDAILVVAGIVIGIGVVMLGIVLIVLTLYIAFIVWLASISVTGTILAILIVIGTIIWIVWIVKKDSSKLRYRAKTSSSDYPSFSCSTSSGNSAVEEKNKEKDVSTFVEAIDKQRFEIFPFTNSYAIEHIEKSLKEDIGELRYDGKIYSKGAFPSQIGYISGDGIVYDTRGIHKRIVRIDDDGRFYEDLHFT